MLGGDLVGEKNSIARRRQIGRSLPIFFKDKPNLPFFAGHSVFFVGEYTENRREKVIMVSHNEQDMTDKSKNLGEQKRLFSIAAQKAVSDMLNGKVEIHPDDIQLEIKEENIGAIFINGRLSNNSNFKKMWMESSCMSELKIIAQKAIDGKL